MLIAVVPLVLAACSGGSDSGAATPTATGGSSPAAGTTEEVRSPVDLEALQQAEPEIVDPDAETRCDRIGYPCSWSDVPEADFERSHQLSLELEELTLAEADPAAGLDAALVRLADVDDLAELIVDREGLTGLMFRLDGLPEMYAMTLAAGLVGEPELLDLAVLGIEPAPTVDGTAADTPATGEPQGIRGLPQDYQPTGGPIVPKRALVVDPYANTPVACPKGAPAGATCRSDGGTRLEGSIISAILDAPEQITSIYAPALDDPSQPGEWDPILGPPLSEFDLVHIASHGSSGCGGLVGGWVAALDQLGKPISLPDRCFSMSAIGTYDKARYAALPAKQRVIPDGLSLAGDKWVARDDYYVGKFKPTAIVYMSNCTSADGSLFASGRYGSFVGWHSYARATTAASAAIKFWDLMATEGLEFEHAIEQLDDAGLTSTFVLFNTGAAAAEMAHGGKNLRARDVITLTLDGQDPDGQVLRVEGLPGDGQPEVFPAQQQQVSFEVEGVREGTAGDVQIEFYYDGKVLDVRTPIKLDTDGTIIDEQDDWATWRVVVNPSQIEIPDTTAADFTPTATAKPLEVRAFINPAEYTADRGNVRLGTLLASNGPLPIFTELAAGLPPNATVSGNDLRIEFDTDSGAATGFVRVDITAAGLDFGYWQLDLTGTYDPATGRISGDLTGVADARVNDAGIFGDAGGGTWDGTVSLGAKTLTAALSINGQGQAYTGTITPVVTG